MDTLYKKTTCIITYCWFLPKEANLAIAQETKRKQKAGQ